MIHMQVIAMLRLYGRDISIDFLSRNLGRQRSEVMPVIDYLVGQGVVRREGDNVGLIIIKVR